MAGSRPDIRVLYLHSSDDGYGADRVLLAMARLCGDRGWEARVLLPDDVAPGWLSRELAAIAVPVSRGPLGVARRRYLTPRMLPRYVVSLLRARSFVKREIRDFQPAIVHVGTSALVVGALLRPFPRGTRLVWHVHEIAVSPRPLAAVLRRLPTATGDRVIAVSDAVLRHLAEVAAHPERIVRIYNGFPDRPPSRAPDSPELVTYVGRISERKGYQDFLAMAARVAKRRPAVSFALLGSPPPGEEWRMEDLTDRVGDLELDGRLTVTGYVDDATEWIERSSVVVVPSTQPDSLPTVVLEAMRAARPVVATDHGGAAEMVVSTETGLLVPPGGPPALAEAVLNVLGASGWAAMGRAGRERFCEQFSEERFRQHLDRVYVDLVGPRPPRS